MQELPDCRRFLLRGDWVQWHPNETPDRAVASAGGRRHRAPAQRVTEHGVSVRAHGEGVAVEVLAGQREGAGEPEQAAERPADGVRIRRLPMNPPAIMDAIWRQRD